MLEDEGRWMKNDRGLSANLYFAQVLKTGEAMGKMLICITQSEES